MNDQIPPNAIQAAKKVEEDKKEFMVPALEKSYDTYFDQITEMQEGDIVTNQLCKFCMHPLRAEAESKWEQTKGEHGKGSYIRVINFLNSKADEHDGVTFTYGNVTAHLRHHYEQTVKRTRLRNYAKDISKYMNYKQSKNEMFESLVQANYHKFLETGANYELDPVKQADMMTKLTKCILEISTAQAKMSGDVNAVDLYKEKFHTIMVTMISGEEDPARKRKFLQQLDDLREDIVE